MKKGTIIGIMLSVGGILIMVALAITLTIHFKDEIFPSGETPAQQEADAVLQALNEPVPETTSAEKKASEKDTSEKKTSENKDSEKQDPEKKDSDKKNSEQKSSGKNVSDTNTSDTKDSAKKSSDKKETNTESSSQKSIPMPEPSAASALSPDKTSFIWVGDSRTVGMGRAVKNNDIFIGADGEGYHWFSQTGMAQLEDSIKAHPDLPVIINFGVNDNEEISKYLAIYSDLVASHPDTQFFFLSVNPIEPTICHAISNEEIADFNSQIREAFPDQYIDSFTYLMINQTETIDGVHYSSDSYNMIYDFAASQVLRKIENK